MPINKEHSVMAIINITPDSFYEKSRCLDVKSLEERLRNLRNTPFDILDIGSYSSRPNAKYVSKEEELNRLLPALQLIKQTFPEAVISIDTFRADVAEACIKQFDIDIINDISGGTLDERMYDVVAKYQKAYILMHMKGNPQTMLLAENTQYENLLEEIMDFFDKRIKQLEQAGCKNIILDPGFGFAKTTEQNYTLLKNLQLFKKWGYPLLVGFSRKSMIWKPLNITPESSLNGTTVLNTLALTQGANILRVHDVNEAYEAIKLFTTYNHA